MTCPLALAVARLITKGVLMALAVKVIRLPAITPVTGMAALATAVFKAVSTIFQVGAAPESTVKTLSLMTSV